MQMKSNILLLCRSSALKHIIIFKFSPPTICQRFTIIYQYNMDVLSMDDLCFVAITTTKKKAGEFLWHITTADTCDITTCFTDIDFLCFPQQCSAWSTTPLHLSSTFNWYGIIVIVLCKTTCQQCNHALHSMIQYIYRLWMVYVYCWTKNNALKECGSSKQGRRLKLTYNTMLAKHFVVIIIIFFRQSTHTTLSWR